MLEQNRQIVLFGDFNAITFDAIDKLIDIKTKYGLHIQAAPDYNIPNVIPQQNRINGPMVLPGSLGVIAQGRPVLQTSAGTLSIFLGSGRLHVEEINQAHESYDAFCDKAKDILKSILSAFDVKIVRVAMNGQLFDCDANIMNTLYANIFNQSKVILSNSDEWQFRINNITTNKELQCDFNNIISMNRNINFDTSGKKQDVLSITYDINTRPGIDRLFSYDDIEVFCKQGNLFRDILLQYMRK